MNEYIIAVAIIIILMIVYTYFVYLGNAPKDDNEMNRRIVYRWYSKMHGHDTTYNKFISDRSQWTDVQWKTSADTARKDMSSTDWIDIYSKKP
jgi:hypothetical protein